MKFPTKKVAAITGQKAPTKKGDTYVRWNDGSIKQLKELLALGACAADDRQNASPSIQEFIDYLEPFGKKVELIGYIIWPPREDARISVEGFKLIEVTADELLDAVTKFGTADEFNKKKLGDNKYNASFWWD